VVSNKEDMIGNIGHANGNNIEEYLLYFLLYSWLSN